jgi:hypothetical protein
MVTKVKLGFLCVKEGRKKREAKVGMELNINLSKVKSNQYESVWLRKK